MKIKLFYNKRIENIHQRSFLAGALFVFFSFLLNAQTFPPGFSQVQVATIYYPTSLAFAPDGRIFTTEKAGTIKIIKNGAVLSTPFYQVSVDQLNERGLSSICLDPNFSTNHFVYIYYTTSSSPIHNRLSRVTANGDVALAGSEVTILDFEPVVNSIHNSGGMVFGNDGKLYLAVGNDNVNANSQDLNTYKGKILRINPDGSVPSGNPFSGSASANRIWAYGFRNPWTLAIQPGTGKIFANDVGEASWEEINDITTGGKNYGWPYAEGMSTNPAYTNPVYTYPHGTTGSNDGCAVTGGDFFNPASTNYPPQYAGKYFFIDYCNKWINYLDLSSGAQKNNFATTVGGANNYIKVGKDGNLYYFSIGQDVLYKIIYTNNSVPAITTQPVNASVSQGQQATFSVTASGATPLSYQWQKNGVNISGANSATYVITNVQTSDAGSYRAVVTNSFGSATSNSATLTVTAFNASPVATISTPPSGTFYRSGDTIHFAGDGTDTEDGTLPASAFHWIIYFHHDNHTHPGPTIPVGTKTGSFSSNFGGETSANVYWHITLIVTDSKGATDTAFVDVHPITSTLSLASQPSGLQLSLEGQPHTTPYSVLAVSGTVRTLGAPSPQILGDSNYVFDHWLQGGRATQTVTVTDANKTYTAKFISNGIVTCSSSGSILREYWANVAGTTVSTVPVTTTPTSTSQLTIFEAPSNVADNYGQRIRGYICPPVSGNYIFWIASDDNSELWLSTNSDPANKQKIAYVVGWTASREWTKYPSQQSTAIYLTAGTKYYIEAIHKEGTQGDNLAVGWQLPNGVMERPIPGSRLSPYASGNTTPVVAITSPANNASFSNNANITINANATESGGTITKVDFYQGTTLLKTDLTAPYGFTWMNVPTGNYQLKAVATDNNANTGTSQAVNIVVTTCVTPTITPSGPTTLCSGSVTLFANTGSGFIYQWEKDGVNISGATNSSYVASVSGNYQVKIIYGSCITWSAPTTVKIQSGLSAQITAGGPTTFCVGGNVKLFANTCSGYSYQWIKDGANISGATSSTYTATVTGNYQLKITLGTSSAWSALLSVTANTCGVEKQDTETKMISEGTDSSTVFQMKVYPNPNSGLFTIALNMPSIKEEKIKILLVDLLGQTVYNKTFITTGDYFAETVELDGSLPAAIYTLKVMVGDRVKNTSVLLSK